MSPSGKHPGVRERRLKNELASIRSRETAINHMRLAHRRYRAESWRADASLRIRRLLAASVRPFGIGYHRASPIMNSKVFFSLVSIFKVHNIRKMKADTEG